MSLIIVMKVQWSSTYFMIRHVLQVKEVSINILEY